MEAGTARRIISHESGTYIQGAGHLKTIDHPRDDLGTNAMWLESGHRGVLFITCHIRGWSSTTFSGFCRANGGLASVTVPCAIFCHFGLCNSSVAAHSRRRRDALQWLAGDQTDAAALIADGVVEQVVGLVRGVPDERGLVGVLLVQTGGVAAGFVEWLGIDGPVVEVL